MKTGMEIILKNADEKELEWLRKNDAHLSIEKLSRKIKDKEILIASFNDEPVGFLRFGYFWDEIPFMNLLMIKAKMRRKGIGQRLVAFWEEEMKKQNHKLIMISTLSNELAQHFYRKLGYKDAGGLRLPGEALEIVFIKEITKRS